MNEIPYHEKSRPSYSRRKAAHRAVAKEGGVLRAHCPHGWEGLPDRLRLPLVISETGYDIGCRQPGVVGSWRGHVEAWQYAGDLNAYSVELEKDRYVLGAAIFCCPNYPGDGWFLVFED